MMEFSHLDKMNQSRMVDITQKDPSRREARASGKVVMKRETVEEIEAHSMAKGDVFGVAKIAGIMAAKKTSGIIPLCHPLELTGIDITFSTDRTRGEVTINAEVRTFGRTGVEMEAMTAVSAAALTIYDMCKSADKEMILTDIKLMRKSGGRSGLFERSEKEKPV
jgi:cyclic pyranopterin phosphate synthase